MRYSTDKTASQQAGIDNHTEKQYPKDNCLNLSELCQSLSISIATGRNWLRLGKLLPTFTEKNMAYFSKEYVKNLQSQLKSGKNTALKSRRNKKFISGNALYSSYVSSQSKNISTIKHLLTLLDNNEIDLDIPTIQLLVADCALGFLANKTYPPDNRCINMASKNSALMIQFLSGKYSIGEYDQLIWDLIEDSSWAISFCNQYPFLFNMEYIYANSEDILGLIYLSCKNLTSRKATGSYYTATTVVKKLIDKLDFQSCSKILDPCCGTGNFLLQLPDIIPFEQVYGNDLDATSVKITRINMALKYNASISTIYSHITQSNFLTQFEQRDFNYIIGNPPWGYDFSENEKAQLCTLFSSAIGKITTGNCKTHCKKNIESFDVFVEQGVNCLAKGGHLAYVLPESILNVKSHSIIRQIILDSCHIHSLDFLGNVFDGVQCPSIILHLEHTNRPLSTVGMQVTTGKHSFTIKTKRPISCNYFSFNMSDQEYHLLNKIRSVPNANFLAGNANFALGIVTGNNKKYISKVKTPHSEPVLRGTDISKYHIHHSDNYIVFQPENFQQVAPTHMYRAPEKLLYRFIGKQLVFAYDDKQTLSLNSCNILIPMIPGLKMKYVLAILNSRVAQFIYTKEFNSVKVLRSHIENIPIPMVPTPVQDEIISLVDRLILEPPSPAAEKIYDQLDQLINQIFQLTFEEMELLQNVVSI